MIDKILNPFDVNVGKSHLFNIATGKSAKEKAITFLLSIRQTGRAKAFRESIITNFTELKLNLEEKRYQTRMAKLLQHVF